MYKILERGWITTYNGDSCPNRRLCYYINSNNYNLKDIEFNTQYTDYINNAHQFIGYLYNL